MKGWGGARDKASVSNLEREKAALKKTKKWFNTQGLFINVVFKLIAETHVATKHEINVL